MKVGIGDTIKIKSRAELYNLASDFDSIVVDDMLEYADCILTIESENINLDYVFYENLYWPINSYDIYRSFFAYHDGCANSCKYKNEIAKLPPEELMEAIEWGTCKWFEEGEPTWSDELSYDD